MILDGEDYDMGLAMVRDHCRSSRQGAFHAAAEAASAYLPRFVKLGSGAVNCADAGALKA